MSAVGFDPSPAERFWSKTRREGECLIWVAGRFRGDRPNSYGSFWFAGKMRLAHRVSYEMAAGPIPEGLQLDHLCGRTLCVNPNHLEPVTNIENMRRRYLDVVSCIHGHPFNDANTYIRPNGGRDCRACHQGRVRRYQERQRAQGGNGRTPKPSPKLAGFTANGGGP